MNLVLFGINKKYRKAIISTIIILPYILFVILFTSLFGHKIFSLQSSAALDQSRSKILGVEDKYPPITSNEDFIGEKTHFKFSPDRKIIAFVQDVFEEYGNDWDKYWAVKAFDTETGEERTLIIDGVKMSSYVWLNNKTIRVFHNAGTGIRVFLDISASRDTPLFTNDYEGPDIWTPDKEYIQEVKDQAEARKFYFESAHKL